MKEYTAQSAAMKPLTLKLICKHAYPKPEYPEGVELPDSDSSYESLDEADKEAIVVEQKKLVEDAYEESRKVFVTQSVKDQLDQKPKGEPVARPIVKRKLGIGLAALVILKKEKGETTSSQGGI